jgi:LPXTG-site transpeptidase (sortase) family protein
LFNEKSNTLSYNEQKGALAEKSVAGATSTGKYNFVATENRLEIPTLGIVGNISYPLNETGVSSKLDSSIVHLPKSVDPGKKGTTVFTAHSSSTKWTYYANIFSSLNRLNQGSLIFVYKGSEVFAYKVYKQEVVEARMEQITNDAGKERIALVTCWPLGTSEKRLVVYGERI